MKGDALSYETPPGCEVPPVMTNPSILNPGSMIYGYGRGSDEKQHNTPVVQQEHIMLIAKNLPGVWGGFFCDVDTSTSKAPMAP